MTECPLLALSRHRLVHRTCPLEFCQLPLGHNPAHVVARVHTDRKSHKPWPDEVVDKALTVSDPTLHLALSLLLYTGQREGDVIKMKWTDIRDDEILVEQEKTGTKVWIPLHRNLKGLLDQTLRNGDFILNTSRGGPFASSQSLYEKIKTMLRRIGDGGYVPHGLRATAAVRLIEAGCSKDQAAAITGHHDLNVLRGYVREANQAKLARRYASKRRRANG